MLCPLNVVALCQASLVLGWLTDCILAWNKPPRSTQPSIPLE